MKISTQTCYFSDDLGDIGIDITSEGKVTLWGFDSDHYKPEDLTKLILFFSHVASIHLPLFHEETEESDDFDPRQLELFGGND